MGQLFAWITVGLTLSVAACGRGDVIREVSEGPTSPGPVGPPVPSGVAGGAPAARVPTVVDPSLPPNLWFLRGERLLRDDELIHSAELLFQTELQVPMRAVWDSEELIPQLSDEQLWQALGCGEAQRCEEQALIQFATRAWRRPLTSQETGSLLRVFEKASAELESGAVDAGARPGADAGDEQLNEADAGQVQGDAGVARGDAGVVRAGGEAVRRFVEAVLSDQKFEILSLLGEAAGEHFVLTDFELASHLSFALTGASPDDELWQAAVRGELHDRTARMAQAERVLSTSATQSYLGARVAGWFHASASAAHPLGAETLNGETERLIQAILFETQDSVARLLDADYTFVTPELAEWYQLPPVPAGWNRVSLEGTRRRGLLHHASWLGTGPEAAHVRYSKRGTVPLNLICQPLPPDPETWSLPEFPEPEVWTDSARREREYLIAKELGCSGCHSLMNSIAFAFDKYDGLGQRRETFDSGQPIDTAGQAKIFQGHSHAFADSADLVTRLAATDEYLDCFRSTWVGELAGVHPSHHKKSKGLGSYLQHSERSERFMDLVLQFVGSDHYVHRRGDL